MNDGDIYVIGDSHIGLSDGDENVIVSWLERLAARNPRALYLNGDVFHYYIGNPNFYTRSVERFFSKLREMRDAGTEIHYVEGNRDFFVRGSLAEDSVSRVWDQAEISAGSRKYLVVHGDMINDRDIPYRFWRRVSKNVVTKLAVRMIPKRIARQIVDRVEARLARANFKHKQRLPVELMEAYGRARSAEGFDTIVFGHFHHKLILEAGDATVAVLPAWFEKGEAMVISPASGEYSFAVI